MILRLVMTINIVIIIDDQDIVRQERDRFADGSTNICMTECCIEVSKEWIIILNIRIDTMTPIFNDILQLWCSIFQDKI